MGVEEEGKRKYNLLLLIILVVVCWPIALVYYFTRPKTRSAGYAQGYAPQYPPPPPVYSAPPPPPPQYAPPAQPAARSTFCTNCGSPVNPQGRFCPKCGTPVS